MTEYTGQQVGNYRLLRRVGRGGFADIYLGSHIHLETEAAIKILHINLVGEGVEQFRQEARTIARLEHPNIIPILDFGVWGKTPFLVMAYAPNGTLRQRHPRGSRVPLAQVLTYVQQVASALQYAHDRRIVHRDIKPENLLIGSTQQILLSDFGIARITPDSQSLHTQDMAGTIAYMAPEQIEGRPQVASDQYALAVLTYEWLCGQRPFEGDFAEVAVKHSTMAVPALREKAPEVPPAVEEVILTALKKKPQQRFVSIQAFSVALTRAGREGLSHPLPPIQSGSSPSLPVQSEVMTPPSIRPLSSSGVAFTPIPTSLAESTGMQALPLKKPGQEESVETIRKPLSPPPSPPKRSGLSRRVVITGLVGLATLGGVGAGLVYWLNRSQATQSPALGSSQAPTATIPVNTTKTEYAAFGFDSGRTHFNTIERQLSPATVGRLKPYWVAPTGSTINSSPAVVNDVVYIGSDDRKLYALNATTGKPLWIVTTGDRVYSSPAVKNGIVYVGSSDGKLYAFEAMTGKTIWTAATGNQVYSSPLVVDGVVYIGSFDSKLYAFEAGTGQKLWAFDTDAYLVSSPALSKGTIYIGSGGGKVHAISTLTRASLWSTSIGSRITSSPAVADGLVYIGSSDMYLYALNASDGKVVWRAPTEDSVASSPAVANGVVYIGSADTHLYALHAKTGKRLWSMQTYNQVNASPTVANGVVYVSSWDGLVYGCDTTTGKVLWTGYTNDHVFSSPAVVNGVVYVGSWDSKVYAFRLK
jgi:outer membrane protein assembly factor BamB